MKLVKDKIPVAELKRMAHETFGDMIKAVVDVEKGVMAIGGELHAEINLKPLGGNKSRWVENPEIRDKITEIVRNLTF